MINRIFHSSNIILRVQEGNNLVIKDLASVVIDQTGEVKTILNNHYESIKAFVQNHETRVIKLIAVTHQQSVNQHNQILKVTTANHNKLKRETQNIIRNLSKTS